MCTCCLLLCVPSTKRAMTPRDRMLQEVDERKLFHGTPSLQAARGICANNMDFRRSGQNVGSLFGKGSYFSAHAVYSHNYTCGPDRYMFLAKVLVGKFTLGKESYTSPPVREGLKLYDSCVDNEANPSIFVIFDLAQSYPEYLIQYEDAEVQSPRQAPGDARPTGSSLSRPGSRPSQGVSAAPPNPDAPKPIPVPRSSVKPKPDITDVDEMMVHLEGAMHFVADPYQAKQTQAPQGQKYTNPYTPTAGADGSSRSSLSYPGQAVRGSNPTGPQPQHLARAAAERRLPTEKKTDSDKCLIS